MTVDELAALLVEAGHAHHAAFIETDGADPEWPMWYAGHLHPRLGDVLGLTQSELIAELVVAARETGQDEPWPTVYAKRLLER